MPFPGQFNSIRTLPAVAVMRSCNSLAFSAIYSGDNYPQKSDDRQMSATMYASTLQRLFLGWAWWNRVYMVEE